MTKIRKAKTSKPKTRKAAKTPPSNAIAAPRRTSSPSSKPGSAKSLISAQRARCSNGIRPPTCRREAVARGAPGRAAAKMRHEKSIDPARKADDALTPYADGLPPDADDAALIWCRAARLSRKPSRCRRSTCAGECARLCIVRCLDAGASGKRFAATAIPRAGARSSAATMPGSLRPLRPCRRSADRRLR
jgi:hypothetical protein